MKKFFARDVFCNFYDIHKIYILVIVFSFTITGIRAQSDTIKITAKELLPSKLQKGAYKFVVFFKRDKSSSASRIFLVNIKVYDSIYNNQKVSVIQQQWEMDTVFHKALTIIDSDFNTLIHNYWWKTRGYSANFNFLTNSVNFEGKTTDSIRKSISNEVASLGKQYLLNWHSDLILFPLIPYRENMSYLINFYDPGFGKPELVYYTCEKSQNLRDNFGRNINCWVLVHYSDKIGEYEKFWISKNTNEVLKEEDYFNNTYRFKLKIATSESF